MAQVKDKRIAHTFKSQHAKAGRVPVQGHAYDMVNAGATADKLAFVKGDETYRNITGGLPTQSEIDAMSCATAQATYNSLQANASSYSTPLPTYIQWQQAQAALHSKITSPACTTPPSGTGGRPIGAPPNPIGGPPPPSPVNPTPPPAAPTTPPAGPSDSGVTSINAGPVLITTTAPVQALGLSPYGGTSVGTGGGGFGGGGGGGGGSDSTDAGAVPLTWYQTAWQWSRRNWWILLLAGGGIVYILKPGKSSE